MKAYYYYYRNELNAPVVTVCLLINESRLPVARGIAICSNSDHPVKKVGRRIAYSKAMQAYHKRRTMYPVRSERALSVVRSVNCDDNILQYKSTYMPDITDFEYDLLHVRKAA